MKDVDYFMAHYTAPGLSLIADCGFPACYGEKGSMTFTFSTEKLEDFQVKKLQAGIADNIIPADAEAELVFHGKEYCLKAEGKAGHSAFPEGTENAIPLLIRQLTKLPEISDETGKTLQALYKMAVSTNGAPAGINVKDSEFGDLTCCAVSLKENDGKWILTFNIRYPDSADYETMTEKLKKYGAEHKLELNISHHLPSFVFPQIIRLFRNSPRFITGKQEPIPSHMQWLAEPTRQSFRMQCHLAFLFRIKVLFSRNFRKGMEIIISRMRVLFWIRLFGHLQFT